MILQQFWNNPNQFAQIRFRKPRDPGTDWLTAQPVSYRGISQIVFCRITACVNRLGTLAGLFITSSVSRVFPMPDSPWISTNRARPATAARHDSRIRISSFRRPTSGKQEVSGPGWEVCVSASAGVSLVISS